MKIKFANKIYEVLFTKELAGLTMYAVEDEPNHIDWLINVEVVDADKKELKKIEQKPTCGDDKKLTNVNHEYFSELLENNNSNNINDYAYQVAYCMSHDWANETPTWDDVQKACKLGVEWNEKRHKSAWSKDDEEHVNSLLKRLEGLCRKKFSTTRFAINEDEDWLKSLKNRIKGE